MRRRWVIISADDFGWSLGITEGILKAHREGIVTSTSLAANMPAAALALSRLAEVPRLGVGMHLNVSQGPPLSRAGRALASTEGTMNRSASAVIMACVRQPRLLHAIESEFEAQIRFALDHGLRPTHLDSHRHVHGYPPIMRLVAKLAQRYRIRFVRRYEERLPGAGWPSASIKGRCISKALTLLGRGNTKRWPALHGTTGTWGIAHTGRINSQWLILASTRLLTGVTEIMTHPGDTSDLRPDETRLTHSREVELAALCDPAVKRAFQTVDLKLVHYGDL